MATINERLKSSFEKVVEAQRVSAYALLNTHFLKLAEETPSHLATIADRLERRTDHSALPADLLAPLKNVVYVNCDIDSVRLQNLQGFKDFMNICTNHENNCAVHVCLEYAASGKPMAIHTFVNPFEGGSKTTFTLLNPEKQQAAKQLTRARLYTTSDSVF